MLEEMLNLIFPPKCEICNTLGKYICDKCYEGLKKYELKNNSSKGYFLYRYEEQIRTMLINYKFNGKSYLCNLFSTCILNNEIACKFINKYDEIIPVPLHKKRKNERGYNQSELVARKIIKVFQQQGSDIVLNIKSLNKIKNTKPQSMQKLENRIQSVKGVYIANNINKIIDKKLLVFDDIYTTGSTYNECKKVLLDAGAKEVGIFTIAKDFMK